MTNQKDRQTTVRYTSHSRISQSPSCLIKNLSEIETLPHPRMKGKGIASSRRACPGGKGEGRVRPSMVSRREVIVKSADEYRKASKKDEDQILSHHGDNGLQLGLRCAPPCPLRQAHIAEVPRECPRSSWRPTGRTARPAGRRTRAGRMTCVLTMS